MQWRRPTESVRTGRLYLAVQDPAVKLFPQMLAEGRCGAPDCGTFCPVNATIKINELRKRFSSTQALDE